jgi:hypothetical protein
MLTGLPVLRVVEEHMNHAHALRIFCTACAGQNTPVKRSAKAVLLTLLLVVMTIKPSPPLELQPCEKDICMS